MKPTHAAKPFAANRVFTDREPATPVPGRSLVRTAAPTDAGP